MAVSHHPCLGSGLLTEVLRGIVAQDLEAVLDFIYLGETKVSQADLERFLALAEELQLKGLSHLNEGLSATDARFSGANEPLSGNNERFWDFGTNEGLLGNIDGLPDTNNQEEAIEPQETASDNKVDRKPIILHTKHLRKNSVDLKTSAKMFKNSEPKPQNHLIKEETAQMVEKLYENQNGIWACLQCAYTSKQRGHLREHVEKHIEGLEYSCNHCGKISRSSHTFRDHLRKKH